MVDDGSTDRTPEVLADYAARDGRIRPVRKSNGGVASALNTALRFARGTWICWLSSDDFLKPDALEAFHGEIARHPEVAFIHSDSFMLLHETGQLFNSPEDRAQTLPEPAFQTLRFFSGNYISGISICIRKTLFDRAGAFRPELHYAQDTDMWLRMSLLAPFHYLDHRTCVTRFHRTQGTSQFPEAGLFDSARLCLDFLNQHPFEDLFPFLDLSRGPDLTRAAEAALRTGLDTGSTMYTGLGSCPAFFERFGEWLSTRCPEAYRAPIRAGLGALMGKFQTLPLDLQAPLLRAAEGRPVSYAPRAPRDLMTRQRQVFETLGDLRQTSLLERYLDLGFAPPVQDRVLPEAFLLEPEGGREAWQPLLEAYLEAFEPGEPVCLLVLLDPAQSCLPAAAEVEAALGDAAKRMEKVSFSDVMIVDDPSEMPEALRTFAVLHTLPLRDRPDLATPSRTRLARRLEA